MEKTGVVSVSVALLLIFSGVPTADAMESTTRSNVTADNVTADHGTTVPERPTLGANETRVVVQLESADLSAELSSSQVVRRLERHANRTQQRVERFAATHEGVTVVRQFWLTNTVVLEVDPARANLTAIAQVEDVTDLHANFEVSVGRSAPRKRATVGNETGRVTGALDHIDAPRAWRAFDTRGEGVKVAVLDNGVDTSHPDVELHTTNASDPTYPGGWAEFDENGQRAPNSTPHTEGIHGTHMSGIVAGGNASGTHVGVAPDAELMHALVATRSSGSVARVVAGIQWAVEQDADVLSISLGNVGHRPAIIQPIRNAEAAGTVVVASVGNEGRETSGPPANVYETVAVGAVTENGSVPEFSGGETIATESTWGEAAPETWPSQYTVPDVVAPGVEVTSAVPEADFEGGVTDGYAKSTGTSVATPLVAGTVALMLSAADERLSPGEIRLGLTATARMPADAETANGTRYGAGVVNASRATAFAADPGQVRGRVTTPSGEPVANVSVRLAGGRVRTTTNSSGWFSASMPAGTWRVSASGFGYEQATTVSRVRASETTTIRLRANETLAVEQSSDDRDVLEAGRPVEFAVRVAHGESLTVGLGPNTSVARSNLTVFVDGRRVEPGESVPTPRQRGSTTLDVEVYTAPGTDGSLDLQYDVRGAGTRTQGRVDAVSVVPRVASVGVVDVAGSSYGPKIASALDTVLPTRYRVRNVTAEVAPNATSRYDVFVVQRFGNDSERVARFLDATDGPGTGVVFLGSLANDFTTAPSDAIRRLAATGDERFTVGMSDSGDGPVSFEIRRNHAIFEGIGTKGDEIEMYDPGTFGDRSWFEGYSGTPLATVTANGSDEGGVAVAVDDRRRRVLLTLGRESFVVGTFSDAANELLGNAVEYATPPTRRRCGPTPLAVALAPDESRVDTCIDPCRAATPV